MEAFTLRKTPIGVTPYELYSYLAENVEEAVKMFVNQHGTQPTNYTPKVDSTGYVATDHPRVWQECESEHYHYHYAFSGVVS